MQSARKNAEDARKSADISKAIADKAYKTEMGMTTAEYLQLRELEIKTEQLDVIKNKANVSISMIMGQAQPFYNIK